MKYWPGALTGGLQGFIPATPLFAHPSLHNRCSFVVLSCQDVSAADTKISRFILHFCCFFFVLERDATHNQKDFKKYISYNFSRGHFTMPDKA